MTCRSLRGRVHALRWIVGPALLLALLAAAAGTAWPVLRGPPSGAVGPAFASSPLDGHWRTFANGDRPNAVLRQGGTLWVGTEGGGLVRWDLVAGTFRQYLHPQDGLPANDVHDVAAGPDGALWLATAGGLARLDPDSDQFRVWTPAVAPDMPGRNATAVLPSGDGRLWVGFAQAWDPTAPHPDRKAQRVGSFLPGGLGRFDPESGAWDEVVRVEPDDRPGQPPFGYKTIPSDNVTALAMDPDGRLWVGTRPYLVWEPEDCVPGACAGTGEWVPSGGGLAAREGERWVQWRATEDGASSCYGNHVTAFAVDQQGRVWVATRGRGVLVMRSGLGRVGCANQVRYSRALREDEGLRGNLVWAIEIDAHGHVWMAHGDSPNRGQGIAVLDHNGTLDDWATPWRTDDSWRYVGLDAVDGRSNALITVLQSFGDGTWAVGAKDDYRGDGFGMRWVDAGFTRWQALRTSDSGLPSNRISHIAADPSSGAVWFALRARGVARYQPGTGTWTWWRAYANHAAVADTIAPADGGARRVQVDLADEAAYEAAFPGPRRFARMGADQTLYELTGYSPRRSGAGPWIYVTPALVNAVREGVPVFRVERGPASDQARQVAVGADGTAWVGGGLTIWRDGALPGSQCSTYPQCYIDGGLGRWDGSGWHVYNDANSPLPRNGAGAVEVGAVELDAAGRVWAASGDRRSSGDGIGVLDPATGQWTTHSYAGGLRAGDGAADFALDPLSGDMWAAHHPVLGYVTLPNGRSVRYFDGGGASRFNGSTWRSWTKPEAPLRLFGDKGIADAVLVDRGRGLVWLGGWDGHPVTYHWGLGRDVDAALNWCPVGDCTDGAWSAKVWPGDGTVASLALDAEGRLWVGTNREEAGLAPAVAGVKLLTGSEWSEVTTANSGLAGNEVSALTAQGSRVWAGTLSRGVSLYAPGPAPTPTPRFSPTPAVSPSATPMPTDEHTPTVAATGSASVTPTGDAPPPTGTATRSPGCPAGTGCNVYLPLVLRR